MEWILCHDRMPEQKQLCLVACYEWDTFTDGWNSVIRYRVLEYLPDIAIWNIKTPLRVLAWIPIPEFTDQIKISVSFPYPYPPKFEGRLCMPEPEEQETDEEDTSVHHTESALAKALEKIQSILKQAESKEDFYEKIRQGGKQLQQGYRRL